ncbi:MAG TPA: hypothetical protein VNG90_01670 [Candidatus Acidoferrum sp.]|nr:hypothetical protein [Candidatus Acidoferrum sp.]
MKKHSQTKPVVPVIYRLQRYFLAASIVLGMAATLLMVLTNPGYYNTQTGEAGLLAGYTHASTLMVQLYLFSSILTFYLLPIGLLAMAWLAMRRAPWLSSIGSFLVLLGMLPLPAIGVAIQALSYDVVRAGSDPALVAMVQHFNADGVMSFYNTVDVPGIVFGPMFIGIALWRSRAVPVWSAVTVTISRLVVFLFPLFASLPGVYLQSLSCSLLLIGSLPAAFALLKLPYYENQKVADI